MSRYIVIAYWSEDTIDTGATFGTFATRAAANDWLKRAMVGWDKAQESDAGARVIATVFEVNAPLIRNAKEWLS